MSSKVQSELTHMQWRSAVEPTQAGDSEVEHRAAVAAGVDHMILRLKDQAAAFRRRTQPGVFIVAVPLGAQGLSLTLEKETGDED